MTKYDFPVPRPRGIQPSSCEPGVSEVVCTRDMVLHVALGRFAQEDGSTWELETIFNPSVNAIDIDIPDEILQSIETVGVGPNLQRYMNWLHPVLASEILPAPLEVTDLTISEGYEKWDDLRVSATNTRVGATNPPTWTKVKDNGAASVGVQLPVFANAVLASENQVYFQVQLPHAWKEGSNIRPHVHWQPVDGNAGAVRWGLEYTMANINEVFPNTTIIYGTSDAFTGAEDTQFLTSLGEIDMTGMRISCMINCRLFRNSSHTEDTYASGAGFLEIDFHHQIDSLGSDQLFIKEY